MTKVITKAITNFGGRLTRLNIGDVNSGLAKYQQTFGADPYVKPGQLTWQENAVQIDPSYSVVTDLVMDGQERIESGVTYVYAVGHTGRVYKIQVNDPASYNPNYDNPVLLTTLTVGSPTFTRGGSLDFFGSTERIYIGHDKGITRIDINGANETALSGSFVQNVPRPLKQFIGKLYAGNGPNVAEIDSTGTVTSSTKISPGFPDNTQVRDLDLSTDGNYLHAVVSRLALADLTSPTQDTTYLSNTESYIFKWNGVDMGTTAVDSYTSFSLNANTLFGDYQYVFGYDIAGAAVFAPTQKILTLPLTQSPLPNNVVSDGNIVAWGTVEFYNGFLRGCNFLYGSFDQDIPTGLWRQSAYPASGAELDVVRSPWSMLVSNFGLGSVVNGYPNGVFGTGKVYFSTLETSPAPTVKYKFYKFYTVSSGFSTSQSGVYETQNELFSEKIAIKEIRVYGEPWIAGNSFKIDIIDSSLSPITNGTKTFTAGTNLTIGKDFAWYNPGINKIYSYGIRISNLGSTNNTINKIEIDYTAGGQ